MRRKGLIFALCLLATGVDVRAQDFNDEPSYQLEGIGSICTALTVFTYARNESFLGRALVAYAVTNATRLLPHGSDACDAVTAPGRFPRMQAWPYPRNPVEIDAIGWHASVDATRAILDDDYDLPRALLHVTHVDTKGAKAPAGLVWAGDVGELSFYRPVDELAGAR